MPALAPLHPAIVHFAIALLFCGVLFRWLSFFGSGRLAFTGPAAATLLLVGTAAAVLAAQSGLAAHGPVERVPGARAAVQDHEEWGKDTRDIFLAVALLEIAALAIRRTPYAKYHRAVLMASGVVGLAGAYALYQAGDKGGDLVYRYAGGVGIRSGDPTDIRHLLMAGLYHQAMADRRAGKAADAAQLIGQLAQRYPDDTAVRLLSVESLIVDRHDARGALAALTWFPATLDSRFLRFRVGLLRADAFAAAGAPDSAKLLLRAMSAEFSDNGAIRDRLAKLN
jgi:uncharacterized membrane protein